MTATISISTSRISGVAPLSVHFDATATTSTQTTRPFHELSYYWDCDDAAETYSGGKSGACHAHVFDQPGSYVVLLYVVEPDGSITTSAVPVTVTDPDTVFAGTATVCVSTDGDFTGAPAGSTQVTSSDFDAMLAAHLASNKRVLFKRGQTFTASAGSTFNDNTGPSCVGAFGTGTSPDSRGIFANNPIVNVAFDGPPMRFGSTGQDCNDARIMDLELAYTNGGTVPSMTTVDRRAEHLLFYRIKADGFRTSYSLGHEGPDSVGVAINRYVCVANCDHQDQRNYGCYFSGDDCAILNSNFVRTDFSTTDHEHVMRFPVWTKLVVSGNNIDGPNTDKSNVTLRARTYTGSDAEISRYCVFSDNTVPVTITWALHFGTGSASRDERVEHLLCERNFFEVQDSVRTQNFGTTVYCSGQQATFRNNKFGMLSTTVTESTSITVAQRGAGTPNPTGVAVYHNTFRSDQTWARHYFANAQAHDGGNVPVTNNLLYAPNCGDLRQAQNFATATTNYTGATPDFVSPTDWSIGASSGALGYGSPVPVLDDYAHPYGGVRDASTPDAGAYEFGTFSPPSGGGGGGGGGTASDNYVYNDNTDNEFSAGVSADTVFTAINGFTVSGAGTVTVYMEGDGAAIEFTVPAGVFVPVRAVRMVPGTATGVRVFW